MIGRSGHLRLNKAGLALAAVLALVLAAGTAQAAQPWQSGACPQAPVDAPLHSIQLIVEGRVHEGFVGVAGLDSETEVIELLDGSEPGLIHKLPGRTRYADVRLTRPLGIIDELWEWRQVIAAGDADRRNSAIILIDPEGIELARWNLFNSWPVKWEGPVAGADGCTRIVEQISLAVERIDREF